MPQKSEASKSEQASPARPSQISSSSSTTHGPVKLKSIFPAKQKVGGKGILDGLPWDKVLPLFSGTIPSSFTDPILDETIWWWRRDKCPANIARIFSSMKPSLSEGDGGTELGYWYEVISRSLGKYLYGVPFPCLDPTEIARFQDLTSSCGIFAKNINRVGLMFDGLLVWDGVAERSSCYPKEDYWPKLINHEDWTEECIKRMKGKDYDWTPSLAFAFNIKKNAASIAKEIEAGIERIQKELGVVTTGNTKDRRDWLLLEEWDIMRWRQDKPDKCKFENKSLRRSQINSLSKEAREKFKTCYVPDAEDVLFKHFEEMRSVLAQLSSHERTFQRGCVELLAFIQKTERTGCKERLKHDISTSENRLELTIRRLMECVITKGETAPDKKRWMQFELKMLIVAESGEIIRFDMIFNKMSKANKVKTLANLAESRTPISINEFVATWSIIERDDISNAS